MKSHSKCDICSKGDAELSRLLGNNSALAKEQRSRIIRALAIHEERHLGMRQILDDAGFKAMCTPREQWTLIIDAATQKNFNLPKFRGRYPKAFAKLPFWEQKLMCVYAYGYGFVPYIVHNSQSTGSNLTWTVIWETICDMRDHYGHYADVLHLQLDNTKADNKNYTMIRMAAWLVKSGRFKQVRVYFLLVGHTHIIIDQIFGAITTGTRGVEMFLPEDLISNIEDTCKENPQWMAKPVRWLKSLFDFAKWTDLMEPYPIKRLFDGEISDEQHTYQGMQDFQFLSAQDDVLLQYREHHTHPFFPLNSPGCKTIKVCPMVPPALQKLKTRKEWAMLANRKIEDTIAVAVHFAKDLICQEQRDLKIKRWQEHISNVPPIIELLPPADKLEFRHLLIPSFRLGYNGAASGEQEHHEQEQPSVEDSFRKWLAQNLAMRLEPMPFDPVVSTEQSQAVADHMVANYKFVLGANEPTLDISQALIFQGSFHLVSPRGTTGVQLCKVADIPRGLGPRSLDAQYVVHMFEHSPNPDVSGLFGTFKPKFDQNPNDVSRKVQVRMRLSREEMVVCNVTYVSFKHVVDLRSLRTLARALPDDYPVPEVKDLPETHIEPEDADHVEQPRKTAARSKKPTQRSVRAARKDSSDEEEEDNEQDEDDEDTDDCESSSDGETEHQLGNNNAASEPNLEENDADDDEGAPILPSFDSSFLPKPGTLVFVNMVGDSDKTIKRMKYPAVPAYVSAVNERNSDGIATLDIRWFGGSTRSFDDAAESGKTITFPKFWNTKQKKKKNSKAGEVVISEEELLQQWATDTIDSDTLVTVHVPDAAYDGRRIWDRTSAGDCIAISGPFWKDLVAQCIKQGIRKG